jgi:hypothetical protein
LVLSLLHVHRTQADVEGMKHENSLLRMELEKLGGGTKTDFFNPTAVGIQVAIAAVVVFAFSALK